MADSAAPFEFKLPDLGEGLNEAQLLTWKVTVGQEVAAFDPLCEVESAKAAVELTAPVAGTIVETRFAEGETAHRGDTLVIIDTGLPQAEPSIDQQEPWFGIVGAPPAVPRSASTARASAAQPTAARPAEPSLTPLRPSVVDQAAPGEGTSSVTERRPVLAAPFVRRLARERGIRLEDVPGSGPQGRVRVADLEQFAAAPSSTPPAAVPLSGLRKAIADHMVQAWQSAPQVTSMDLFDVTALVQARESLQASAEAEGGHLTFLPFFVKAAVEALKVVPEANALLTEHGLEQKSAFHIGIATAIPGGLVVPVVRHAERLSLLELASEVQRVVQLARERRASPAELTGSTFTITSFGGLPGSPLFATPILNHPEVAILGLGRVDWQARVIEGQVVARRCIGVSLTFDHRVLDGEGAGRLMAALKRYVEQPLELLLKLR